MSFSPKSSRVSVSNAFTPRSNITSNFRATPYDRLGTIVEYGQYTDASNRSYPTIVIKEDETGRIYEAKMSERAASQAQVARSSSARPGTLDNFRGNIIDELMQKHLPIGDRVVLEGTLPIKGGKVTVSGQERSIVDCNYVTHVTEPSPKKTYRAIITAKADSRRPDGLSDEGEFIATRVRDYQDWSSYHKSHVSKDGLVRGLSSSEEIDALAQALDESRKTYEAGQRRPGLGVMFRTYIPVVEGGEQSAQVIDDTPLFEWVRAERDPNDPNKIIVDGYPLDGAEFRNLYSSYHHYIFGNAEENMVPKFDEEILAKAKIEIFVYHSHMASNYSKYNQISENPKHPLRRLCFSPTKHSQDDTNYSYGKNMAVSGIMMLTGDQFNKSEGSIVSRDMVRRVFFGGPTGNLHAFLRTSDGLKARLHPALDNPAKQDKNERASTPTPTSSALSSVASPTSAIPFDEDDDSHDHQEHDGQDGFDRDEHNTTIPSSGSVDNEDFFRDLLGGNTESVSSQEDKPAQSAPKKDESQKSEGKKEDSSSRGRRGRGEL